MPTRSRRRPTRRAVRSRAERWRKGCAGSGSSGERRGRRGRRGPARSVPLTRPERGSGWGDEGSGGNRREGRRRGARIKFHNTFKLCQGVGVSRLGRERGDCLARLPLPLLSALLLFLRLPRGLCLAPRTLLGGCALTLRQLLGELRCRLNTSSASAGYNYTFLAPSISHEPPSQARQDVNKCLLLPLSDLLTHALGFLLGLARLCVGLRIRPRLAGAREGGKAGRREGGKARREKKKEGAKDDGHG
jgi:hypothetical protein